MRSLDVIPNRWLEYEPPGLCHTGLETLFALGASAASSIGSAAAAAAPTIGAVATIGGTGLLIKSGLDQAEHQSAVARAEAAALQQKSNEDAAVGQRKAISEDRKTALVQSRARALAAASGTDPTSSDIVDNEGDIAQQGSYNALSALYEGQARSRSDLYQSDIELFKARRISAAAPIAAGGTLLSGISALANNRLRRDR